MEIRCSECEHLGVAADVRQTDDGVGLVCDRCGHLNEVAAGGESGGTDGTDQGTTDADVGGEPGGVDGTPEIDLDELGVSKSGGNDGLVDVLGEVGTTRLFGDDDEPESPEFDFEDDFAEASVRRLIPEPGEGERCRKCLSLLQDDRDHCGQCGLSIAEARKHPPGEAPFEQPPEGREEDLRRAEDIWEAVWSDDESESLEDYADFIIERGLVDHGIRNVQRRLVDHPDDREAIGALERLAESLEVAVDVARTQAEAQSDAFQDDVRRFRTRLLLGALVFWTVLLLLLSWMFWDLF